MEQIYSKVALALYTSASLFLMAPLVTAQNIGKTVNKADNFAKAGDWDKAYPLYIKASERLRKGQVAEEGLAYLYYRRGQAAQIMGKRVMSRGGLEVAKPYFKDAIKALKACSEIGNAKSNRYKNKVVYMMGQCQQSLKDFKGAIGSYDTFKRDFNVDNVDEKRILKGPGFSKYVLGKATCYFNQKTPDRSKGVEMLSFLMQPENRAKYKISGAAVIGCFRAYCMSIQKAAEGMKRAKDEVGLDKLERELVTFMVTHRDGIALQPYLMFPHAVYFLQLSTEMRDLEMHRASFVLQSFLPDTIVSKEEMEFKLKQLGEQDKAYDHFDLVVKNYLIKDLATLQKYETYEPYGAEGITYMPLEIYQDFVLLRYHEDMRNSRAAFAIYEMIELYHNDHPKREEMLFHLIRTSYNIGAIDKTTKYGQLFIKDFPNSKRVSKVEKFMLTSLFANGKYAKCMKIAETMLPKLKARTTRHDIALYCLAGSYYYQGLAEKARVPLAMHVKLYGKGAGDDKESQYAMATQYWDGSNHTYLNQWKRAAEKLDKFLADYPDPAENTFFLIAKYDRANCHTQAGENQQSINHLNGICENHKDSSILDRAFALRGNNYQRLAKFEEAHSDYKAALELSQKANNGSVEAEVLHYLVNLLGDKHQKEGELKKKNFAEAVKYYDRFWNKYSLGPYSVYVAVSGFPALAANGRGEEGLAHLKKLIIELADGADTPRLDAAVQAYVGGFLEQNGNDIEVLRNHFAKDFKLRPDQALARSLFQMSLVDLYLKLAREVKIKGDKEGEKKYRNAAKALLAELAKLEKLDLGQFNAFTLITIAEQLRKSATSKEGYSKAIKFYEKVIENAKNKKSADYTTEAFLGLAECVLETRDLLKLNPSIAQLRELKNTPNMGKASKEKAHYYEVSLSYMNGKNADAIEAANSFLKAYPKSKYKVLVQKNLGDAYFNTNKLDEAMQQYQNIAISHTPVVKHSGPAILRVMEIANIQGKPFEAFMAGKSFINILSNNRGMRRQPKAKPAEIDLMNEIKKQVQDLENHPEVIQGIKEGFAKQP